MGVHFNVSRGLTVDPCVYVAFFPSQVLADPVSRQSPFAPFVANGAFGNGQDCGYVARCRVRETSRRGCLAWAA